MRVCCPSLQYVKSMVMLIMLLMCFMGILYSMTPKIYDFCPTCFALQCCLGKDDHTCRSLGPCSAWSPTQERTQPLRRLTPLTRIFEKYIQFTVGTIRQKFTQSAMLLTASQLGCENVILISSLVSPGMVGVKMMGSLTLANGPTSPSST